MNAEQALALWEFVDREKLTIRRINAGCWMAHQTGAYCREACGGTPSEAVRALRDLLEETKGE